MNLPQSPNADRMRQIADDMLYLLSQDMLDGEIDRLADKSPIEIATYFYLSSDCDAFAVALMDLTGADIVSVHSPTQGPVHRIAKLPDGELVDAGGVQTLASLVDRYKIADLELSTRALANHVDEEDIDLAKEVIAALDIEPFLSIRAKDAPKP